MCRQWFGPLAGNFSVPLLGILAAEVLVDLQDWLATLDYAPPWQWVLCIDGTPPDPLPIELARTMLDAYLCGGIQPVSTELTAWDA